MEIQSLTHVRVLALEGNRVESQLGTRSDAASVRNSKGRVSWNSESESEAAVVYASKRTRNAKIAGAVEEATSESENL